MHDPTPGQPPSPAPPVAAAGEEVLDFSVQRSRVLFRLDPEPDAELFEAAPALPTGLAVEIAGVAEQLQASNGDGQAARLQRFFVFFDRVLKPGSRERFRERLSDVDRPIDPAQLTTVIQGLMGRWGLRPTQPSPGSSPPPPSPAAGSSLPAELAGPASVSTASPSTSS